MARLGLIKERNGRVVSICALTQRLQRIQCLRCRTGITRLELLIVCAVIALIVALMLPPLAKSRETARQMQCKENLRQLGVALRSYHEMYRSLPPGYVLNADGPYLGWGWGMFIQPYTEAGSNYFELLRYAKGIQNEYEDPIISAGPSYFRCPSDRTFYESTLGQVYVVTSEVRNWQVVTGSVVAINRFSRSNYLGVAGYLRANLGGIERDDAGMPPEFEPQINAGSLGNIGTTFLPQSRYCDQNNFRGVFGQNSLVTFEQIRDGLSHTFLVGERAAPSSNAPGAIGKSTWIGVPDCSTAAGLSAALGDTSVRLNVRHRLDGTQPETTGFSSAHFVGSTRIEGSHFLLADGSVRFVRNDIDIRIYRDLSTIDDGRDVGDF